MRSSTSSGTLVRSRRLPGAPHEPGPTAPLPTPRLPAPRLPAPRLPAPRLLAPRLPAPRLPAPRLLAPCLPAMPACAMPCHHRLIAHRIRTRAACHPVSASLPPPSLLACATRCDSSTPRLLEPAIQCHLATLCDSAPTPSVLRSRRPTRMACHLSPLTRGLPSQSSPTPSCSAESDFPNSQGQRPAFATTRLPRHRLLSLGCPCLLLLRACPCASSSLPHTHTQLALDR